MHCPNCSNQMTTAHIDGRHAPLCAKCDGRWLSGASITELLEREISAPSIRKITEIADATGVLSEKRKCPSCISTYLSTCEVRSVELDICVNCCGVFFDYGEISKILPQAPEETANGQAATTIALDALVLTLGSLL